jgi:hypothetical protein
MCLLYYWNDRVLAVTATVPIIAKYRLKRININMRELLLKLIQTVNPKKISQAIKKDSDLYQKVMAFPGNTISEKIFCIVNEESNICKYGNTKKFKSITQGYGFCGPTTCCGCAKQTISKKVSQSKQAYSQEKKNLIQQKRQDSVFKKYGVNNVGQTTLAKQNHQAVYQNQQKVTSINQKIKKTKQKKYADANYNNSAKIKNTFKQKRKDKFWINKWPEKNIQALEDPNQMMHLHQQYTPAEIAQKLNVHIQTVYRWLNTHNIRTPFKSSDETEVLRYVESLGIINIITNTRKILPSRRELDIFLPDQNIAIEYNGVYWHHEDVDHITRDYHRSKFLEAEQQGIQLITIFSTAWHTKKDIVKNTLARKLGCTTQSRVYARNCIVKSITNKESKLFLELNHIQGYTPANTTLGCFHNDLLVAVMSFSKSRLAIGKPNQDTELVRYATVNQVVGGAGKLLSHYQKLYPNESIISYSNNEWSNGNLYQQLGFCLEREVPHSYWYLFPRQHQLYHRFAFSKQKLIAQGYDPTKSESEITREMGLLKIWDCGKRKWRLEPK